MNDKEYQKFCERYDKFKLNNLPTPFWDDERLTLEYVSFPKTKYIGESKTKRRLDVERNIVDALGNVTFTGLYYPFTAKEAHRCKKNGKIIDKFSVEHSHAHLFDEVVRKLYNSPESFNISKDEEIYYSDQELRYLRRVQKYLLFIGMKDLETRKAPVSRYRNKIHRKYENAYIFSLKNNQIKDIKNGQIKFLVYDWYPEYVGNSFYKQGEFQALFADEEDNIKLFVEFTKREETQYKNIKKVYKFRDLADDDKVILKHFKILDIF